MFQPHLMHNFVGARYNLHCCYPSPNNGAVLDTDQFIGCFLVRSTQRSSLTAAAVLGTHTTSQAVKKDNPQLTNNSGARSDMLRLYAEVCNISHQRTCVELSRPNSGD